MDAQNIRTVIVMATTSSVVTVFQLTVIMIIPRIRKTGSLQKMSCRPFLV